MRLKQTDLAYAAGIIDGEGTFSIHNKKQRKAKSLLHCGQIAVGMTKKEVPFRFKKLFGGCNRTVLPKNKKHSRVYYWSLWSNQAAAFLKKVLPYLITRKAQALLFLEFQKYMQDTHVQGGWYHTLSASVIKKREGFVRKMHKLNRRGRIA